MELVHVEGLNCYHSCIINAANLLGAGYLPAFGSLWSEHEFAYDGRFKLYLSKRMALGLEASGVCWARAACFSPEDGQRQFDGLEAGEWFVAGMDAFYMPWNEYYQTLNGAHYFFGQKTGEDRIRGFDPSDQIREIRIAPREILPYVFDFIKFTKIEKGDSAGIQQGIPSEARAVQGALPGLRSRLAAELMDCTAGERGKAARLAKYTDALYGNRCLFRHYLQKQPDCPAVLTRLFSDGFLRQWGSLKYGLYKISLLAENHGMCRELRGVLWDLLTAEILAAEKMIGMDFP